MMNSDGNDQMFYLQSANKQHMFYWSQDERRSDALLPIYTDSGFGGNLQVRGEYVDRQSVDTSASRLLHGGGCVSADGTQLIAAVLNWTNSESGPALFALAAQNHFEQLNTASENGYTPLMYAVAAGNWTASVTLLSLGAQRDVTDVNGNTLLHIAADRRLQRFLFRGHVMILEGLLIFLGNDANRPNSNGDTPMHLAARSQHAACLDRLLNINHLHSNIQNSAGDSPMHIVCGLPESPTKIAMVGRLLANTRLNLHLCNEDELTPVHIAISKDCHRTKFEAKEPIWSEFQLNADVTRCSKLGRTALHLALEKWHGSVDKDMDRLACVQALVLAGCPLNVQDCDGETASHLLVKEFIKFTTASRDCKVVNLPISVFHTITSCSDLIHMNLHDIASLVRPHWQFACMCFLVARGADFSLVDRSGTSVLDGCLDVRVRHLLMDIVDKRPRCGYHNYQPLPPIIRLPLDGVEIQIGEAPLRTVAVSVEEQCRILANEEIERIAAAAAKQAKLDAEREKLRELEELRERLAQLEMETSCIICMDARPSVR
ncbi:unnamed protein product [Angiostrongylus costaricensis]|uniref:ANK_REP_REGION domain-containing protein n=1 Tax=Angiostrongylus costaricensis TaxID=334426 RepID=A0A0R3PPJ8_ANGCS|nr:unnamed protein product [Angiostrongylus costaricensis]